MRRLTLAAALAALTAAALPATTSSHPGSGTVAIKAGTVYLVEDGRVLEGGVTILVRGGKVVEVGSDLEIPPEAQVVDYGPHSVVIPGLVAANSSYNVGSPSARTADPSVRAVDNFDPYSDAWTYDVSGGVTSAYLAPARGRLISGQGAVVKLGEGGDVLSESAALHGTIGHEARSVPGYWEPPVPATVDVGLGVVQQQLPRTTMGAILALRELLDAARGEGDGGVAEYGPHTGEQLAALMQAGTPWRIGAGSETEIRAILGLARDERLPLVIEGGAEAGPLAAEIAESGASVVVKVDVAPASRGRDFGKRPEDRWPRYDAAASLVEAGVPVAIATPDGVRPRELRFVASLASRGGLDSADALRAITLGAAEVLGVDDRVGSIKAGKDADLVVLNGPPMDVGSSVQATWIDGDLAWQVPATSGSGAVVIEADALHVGNGQVLRPGQVLIVDGVIAEIGESVGRPMGAVIVRGAAAMPGMIDAFGHLGLDGSSKTPATDFSMTRIVEPGDFADRRVARAGVTTVVLAPRSPSKTGAPMMAYKPASSDIDEMVVEDPAALHLAWTNSRNRIESGDDVQDLLGKVVAYDQKWKEYHAAMATWVPPPPEPEKDADSDEDEGDDEKKGEDEEEDSKSKKKKKGEDDDEDSGDPLTGVWEGEVVVPPFAEASALRLRFKLVNGSTVAGSLRCAGLSETLILLAGTFEDDELDVAGLGSRGVVHITGGVDDGELEGTIQFGQAEIELEAERTSKEYPEAVRSEMRKETTEREKPPKGQPKQPSVDSKLEPLRAALRGEKMVVVDVDREQEILECVAAFEKVGIKPVLYGADDATRITDELRGRVAGVLLSQQVLESDYRKGLSSLQNRYQVLASAGIPVAFHSGAEEGAAELGLQASFAVAQGMSRAAALRALTGDAAAMLGIDDEVGTLAVGMDGDVLLLDGSPLDPATSVLRAWVNGEEVR